MNQQVFAAIFASVMSTYFGALVLIYVLRTFLAPVVFIEKPSDRGFTPASSSKDEIWTNIATRTELLAE